MRIIDNATVEVQVSYDEPSKDSDNTPTNPSDNPPLRDLGYTSVFYKVVPNGIPVAAAKTPASRPEGGGVVTIPMVVPAPVNQVTSIEFWATATDLTGNTAGDVRTVFMVDRMAPLPPGNFSIA